MSDSMIKPVHYNAGSGNDVIKFAVDNQLDFLQGNVVKYVVRHKEKNGLEDINKAIEYLERIKKEQYGE